MTMTARRGLAAGVLVLGYGLILGWIQMCLPFLRRILGDDYADPFRMDGAMVVITIVLISCLGRGLHSMYKTYEMRELIIMSVTAAASVVAAFLVLLRFKLFPVVRGDWVPEAVIINYLIFFFLCVFPTRWATEKWV